MMLVIYPKKIITSIIDQDLQSIIIFLAIPWYQVLAVSDCNFSLSIFL